MVKPRTPKSFLINAFEAAETPIYLVDAAGVLRYANPALGRIVGPMLEGLLNEELRPPADGSIEAHQLVAEALRLPDEMRDAPEGRFEIPASVFAGLEAAAAGGTQPVGVWEATFRRWRLEGETVAMVEMEPATSRESSPGPNLRDIWLRFRQRQLAEGVPWYLMGESPAALRLREQFEAARKSSFHLQISAPQGSFEEDLARRIHGGRPASLRGPLVSLECTLLDVELLQTTIRELVREAQDQGVGRGCLVLLNIDRLVEAAQVELLNLLSFPQVLFATTVTTRESLRALAEQGAFLPELAERLSVMELRLRPLRERPEDLPDLIETVFQLENAKRRQPLAGMRTEAREALQRYPWPGNCEELLDVVQQVLPKVSQDWLGRGELPGRIRREPFVPDELAWHLEPFHLDAFLQQVEKAVIQMALRQTGGNKTQAAQLLHLTRATFHRKIEQYAGDDDAS